MGCVKRACFLRESLQAMCAEAGGGLPVVVVLVVVTVMVVLLLVSPS